MHPRSSPVAPFSLASSSPLPSDGPSEPPRSPRSPGLSSSGHQPSPSPSSRGWSLQPTPSDRTPKSPRASHFSPRPKSVRLHLGTEEGQAPLESPSPFKWPKPRTGHLASSEGGPVSPRFTPTDPRRSPVPRLDLFNDLQPLPQLPPVPTSPPPGSARSPGSSDDSDIQGEILVEFLKFEHYEILEFPDGETPPSSPRSPSQPQWPASPRSPGGGLPPRGDFLGQKPRDGSQ